MSPVRATVARPPIVRLYVLDCGTIHTTQVDSYGLAPAEAGLTDMSVPCYLIRHGRTWLLFDTGLGDDHAGRADRVVDMSLEVRQRLAAQLAAIRVRPEQVSYVAISHFHFDHVGNLASFPHATLLLQRAEAEKMRTAPYPFSPPAAVARLQQGRIELLDGDRDLFGDGSIVLLSTPGHSPGHQSMMVRLRRTGPVILTGDLYHHPEELSLNRLPPREANGATPASRERVRALAQREGAQIWIGHDLARFRAQRHAPAYYD
jgi:glyoxylase-like metal-dependent hydrolase (beta-lactamase superfamily II)